MAADGWLATPIRLVTQLHGGGERANALSLTLYLPEEGLLEAKPMVVMERNSAGLAEHHLLKPGQNLVLLPCSPPWQQSVVELKLGGAPVVWPATPSDQRRLIVALVDLDDFHAAAQWLRYVSALLHSIELGPEA